MIYHVYNQVGTCIAMCLYAEDAAALVAFLGKDATIRVNGKVVWFEGHEEESASESYDNVALTIDSRL